MDGRADEREVHSPLLDEAFGFCYYGGSLRHSMLDGLCGEMESEPLALIDDVLFEVTVPSGGT